MDIRQTDPEFIERFEYFAYTEVPSEESQSLPEKYRYLAILAVLLGCQGIDAYRQQLI